MAPHWYSYTTGSTVDAQYNNTTTANCSLTYSNYWYGASDNTADAIYVQPGVVFSLNVYPIIEESEQEQEERRKKAEAADRRAEELLKEHIGLEAFGKLHKVGHIELDSQKYSGRKYRVKSRAREYIEVLDESGKVIDRLCIHPGVRCPDGDEILAKVLLIESAEELLLATANHHRP